MFRRPALTLLGLALAVAACVIYRAGAEEEEEGYSGSGPAREAARRHDPVCNSLPLAVVKTYRALFPGHQVWQASQTGRGEDAEIELTIFHPETSSTMHRQVDGASVATLMHYKLILTGDGAVLREPPHPIAADAVPAAVRKAVDQWKRPLQGRNYSVQWLAHQEPKAERLFSVYIELSSVEAYRATLRADGTFVKGGKAIEKNRSKNP